MRYLIPFLLLFIATPLAGQLMTDRFVLSGESENRTLVEKQSPSPLTARKVFASIAGTLVGGVAGVTAGFLVAGSGEDVGAGLIGMVAGATLGATAGAYIPGESPRGTLLPTLGMAALGSALGTGLGFVVPPLAVAGPPAGALLGFALAY